MCQFLGHRVFSALSFFKNRRFTNILGEDDDVMI